MNQPPLSADGTLTSMHAHPERSFGNVPNLRDAIDSCKPYGYFVFLTPIIARGALVQSRRGEPAVVPRVASLFRFYSDPKTTTPQPRLHHDPHIKRRAIPFRTPLICCIFLCTAAVRLSSFMVSGVLEHQCSPLSMFSAVLEDFILDLKAS